jgi:hypothetical protein
MSTRSADGLGDHPLRQIRALYSAESIFVYQAYATPIAASALGAQNFVSPFQFDRMTWIKPSFLWMMYRSNWGQKPGQEHVLRIELQRTAFEWALEQGVLTQYVPDILDSRERWHEMQRHSPVIIQWDPERNLNLHPLSYRTIQIGLRGDAIRRYATEWIISIEDVTALAHTIWRTVVRGELDAARELLPQETPYFVPPVVARRLAITS